MTAAENVIAYTVRGVYFTRDITMLSYTVN